MTATRLAALTCGLAVLSQMPLRSQTPVFRSAVDAVAIPVSVTEKNQPVPGLTAADFQIFDNGVAQHVAAIAQEALPIDVTLLLDTSASVEGRTFEQFKAAVADVTGSLDPNDRVRLVTVGGSVLDVAGMQPGGVRLALENLGPGGGTSLYNALATALIAAPRIDRLQVVLCFTDGLDTTSFINAPDVVRVARHSVAVLYVGLTGTPAGRGLLYAGGPNVPSLRDAAETTGGRLIEMSAKDDAQGFFRQMLDTVRAGYVLRYSPQGVSRPGWHEMKVQMTNRRFTVRARKGYDG